MNAQFGRLQNKSARYGSPCFHLLAIGFLVSTCVLLCDTNTAVSQDPHWIWSPDHDKTAVPRGTCYFRKTIKIANPERGTIAIAADDQYVLYVNGKNVGDGESTKTLDEYNITRYLSRGKNIIAVQVTNRQGNTAAFTAQVNIKQKGGTWKSYSTNASWRSALNTLPLWNTTFYNDNRWKESQVFGVLGETEPWDHSEQVATNQGNKTSGNSRRRSSRFRIDAAFDIERVADNEQTGSLIAMTFNEFGHILASRENGPLLLIYDSDKNGSFDQIREYSDKVNHCQGILALNGHVFVTANGPQGKALYRLSDEDQDGQLEDIRTLVEFEGDTEEHGVHGLTLGPDGLIYIVLGNHVVPKQPYDAKSPHRHYYEGDLVVPRYEDPGGHAVGIKAPGGVVIRTDIDGSTVELVAGGLRNSYDLAFNREGELFVHDSDMESDEGTTWYRPTQLYHVQPGSEFGWRSGWAKWSEYFIDNLPPVGKTGRGSPTGAVVYDHFMLPEQFHNSLFLADWSEGRILNVSLTQDGASYRTQSEVFLEGTPLNVTDLAVGSDGALYFSTGGRGTNGGIYRINWRGEVPQNVMDLGTGISAAIRQPQLHSAWSRQNIASIKQEMGDEWDSQILGVALSKDNPAEYRLRAMDLMQLYGPTPDNSLLLELSEARDTTVRAKAVDLMGLYYDDKIIERLITMLEDPDAFVRRKVCEALVRVGETVEFSDLADILASNDRSEAWAGRRLLENAPANSWWSEALETTNPRVFLQSALAVMIADPSRERAFDVLEHLSEMMTGFVSDGDFLDLLRVLQVSLLRGELKPQEITELRDQLAEEFPSGNYLMNRELARLLAFTQESSALERYLKFLESDAPEIERLHVAFYLRFLKEGWNTEDRFALLDFYENALDWEGGSSYTLYLLRVTRDMVKGLSTEEAIAVLNSGDEWPNAALGAMYRLPKILSESQRNILISLDERISHLDGDAYQRLGVGIVALLARSGDESSTQHLRTIWETTPERRSAVAMGLALSPTGKNWDYLVASLPVLEKQAAIDVLKQLSTVDQSPIDAEHFRQVILLGLNLKDQGGEFAINLLEHWTETTLEPADEGIDGKLAVWQTWFSAEFPDHPPAELPQTDENEKWNFAQLVEYLTSSEGNSGSAENGAEVFAKAQCLKCHRFGNRGERMGQDLTSLSKRFTRKEVLESIVFPSHIISSQFASQTVILANGKTLTGIVGVGSPDEKVILQSDGKKVRIDKDDIEEIVPSKISTMPTGLLNNLTLREISDLFAYLGAIPSRNVAQQPKDTSTK